MASLEEFRFGRLDGDPSSFHQIGIILKKHEIEYKEYLRAEGRLSSHDYYIRYNDKLPKALNEVYSSEDARPPRAIFKFKVPPQPIFLLRGKVLEHTIDWERRFEEFKAFNPFCIPVDRVRQLTKILDLPQLADFLMNPDAYPLDPLILTRPGGWVRIKDQIIEIFDTHQHPLFIKEWLEEVIERGRILSEVELLGLFDKHDRKVMYQKTISLLEHFKIFEQRTYIT